MKLSKLFASKPQPNPPDMRIDVWTTAAASNFVKPKWATEVEIVVTGGGGGTGAQLLPDGTTLPGKPGEPGSAIAIAYTGDGARAKRAVLQALKQREASKTWPTLNPTKEEQ